MTISSMEGLFDIATMITLNSEEILNHWLPGFIHKADAVFTVTTCDTYLLKGLVAVRPPAPHKTGFGDNQFVFQYCPVGWCGCFPVNFLILGYKK